VKDWEVEGMEKAETELCLPVNGAPAAS
jgi:hypothetical protein